MRGLHGNVAGSEAPGFAQLLERATTVRAPPLCPEVLLHLAEDIEDLWREQESLLGERGLGPPYWGIAWPGGQAVARFVLDDPGIVRGARVLDLGCGGGVVALAASLAGARSVEAADVDPYAIQALRANANLNRVGVLPLLDDLIDSDPLPWDVVVAGDLWYERFTARRATSWLYALASTGVRVICGDLARAYSPRTGIRTLATYSVAASERLEQGQVATPFVWEFA